MDNCDSVSVLLRRQLKQRQQLVVVADFADSRDYDFVVLGAKLSVL
jgi:hypothetical protein